MVSVSDGYREFPPFTLSTTVGLKDSAGQSHCRDLPTTWFEQVFKKIPFHWSRKDTGNHFTLYSDYLQTFLIHEHNEKAACSLVLSMSWSVNKGWLGDADRSEYWRSCCCLFLCVNQGVFSLSVTDWNWTALPSHLFSTSHCWYRKTNFWDRCFCCRHRVSHSSRVCVCVCVCVCAHVFVGLHVRPLVFSL